MIENLSSLDKTDKPWGHEIVWARSLGGNGYLAKIIFIKSGHRLSLQFHEEKEETILVQSGDLYLDIQEVGLSKDSLNLRSIKLQPGDIFHINPLDIHRFCAKDTDVTLVEVSTYKPLDVVRLEDDYGRE